MASIPSFKPTLKNPLPPFWEKLAEQVRTRLAARPAHIPYMVRVMSRRDRLIYYTLSSIWVILNINFWQWWLRQDHVVTAFGMVFSSILLMWSVAMPGWFIFFAGRMKKPNPTHPLDALKGKRVAIICTKAPSEPWPVIQKTLMAMSAQDYPFEYDVWLADERPNREVMDWCLEYKIHLSTRHDFGVFRVSGYQNEEFPRRKKSKEGNLSYFYETYAYRDYDFVAQLDADHVPTPTYLKEMMRAFVDPKVGYVAAPSICDANVHDSWVVNARLFAEAPLHGALQAGYNGGWAPMAIGSHYAVRVDAVKKLRHIRRKSFWSREFIEVKGGIGAELAEDHVTTLAMNSAGYSGAFAFDAIAHGDGAASFPDSITQEMQWSRSLMTVLLRWTPEYFRFGMMKKRLKFEFLFAQFWYPAFALIMLISYQMSNIALLLHRPWVNVPYIMFLLYYVPAATGALAPILWVKRGGHLRPSDAKVNSWELIMFQYVRWPWALQGVVQAFVGTVFLNRELNFKVTPKGVTAARPLLLQVLIPYILLVLCAAGTVIAVYNPGSAAGYYFLSLTNAVEYTIVTWVILFQHYLENKTRIIGSPITFFKRPLTVAILLTLLTLFAIALRGPIALRVIIFNQ
jgi:cellulose synthase (UDP-forming)